MKYKAEKPAEETLWDEYLCELQSENETHPVLFPMAQTSEQAKPCRFMNISLCSHYLDTEVTCRRIYPFFITSRSIGGDGWLMGEITTDYSLSSLLFLSCSKKGRREKRAQSVERLRLPADWLSTWLQAQNDPLPSHCFPLC